MYLTIFIQKTHRACALNEIVSYAITSNQKKKF